MCFACHRWSSQGLHVMTFFARLSCELSCCQVEADVPCLLSAGQHFVSRGREFSDSAMTGKRTVAAKPAAKSAATDPPAKRAKVKTSPVKVPDTEGERSAIGAGDKSVEPPMILNHPTHFLMQESQIPNCIQVSLKVVDRTVLWQAVTNAICLCFRAPRDRFFHDCIHDCPCRTSTSNWHLISKAPTLALALVGLGLMTLSNARQLWLLQGFMNAQ